MSKLTLDKAIKHCLEVANSKEMEAEFETDYECYFMTDKEREECKECAADHRQLAEWLTDYKELRNSVGAVKLKDMKDAVGLLQELNTENDQLTSQLADAKRLLNLAVEDFDSVVARLEGNDILCMKYIACKGCPFDSENCNKWRGTDEALKLIES